MRKAEEKFPGRYFDFPDDTVKVRIDPATGCPAPSGDPNAVEALFKKGTEPNANGV
jgi:membrane carboxypeptidase/penicillin-binding protein